MKCAGGHECQDDASADNALVKSRDPVDNTALHLAASQTNEKVVSVVKLLCESKAQTEVPCQCELDGREIARKYLRNVNFHSITFFSELKTYPF